MAKIALQQVKKASQVHPMITLAHAPSLEPKVSTSSNGIDIERGNEENGNAPVKPNAQDQRIREECKEKAAITKAIQVFTMNGNENKNVESRLPIKSMMECPNPFTGPSINIQMSGHLSPSISVPSPKQELSPCRFRKFQPKDPFCVVAESTNNGLCTASDNGNRCWNGCSNMEGKRERKGELTTNERFSEKEVLKNKSSCEVNSSKEDLFIKINPNIDHSEANKISEEQNSGRIELTKETMVGNDVKDDETKDESDKNVMIKSLTTVKALSFKCRQLRNISKLKRTLPSNSANGSGHRSPTHCAIKGNIRIFQGKLNSNLIPYKYLSNIYTLITY